MTSGKQKKTKDGNPVFDEKLIQKAADMSEKDLTAFVKAARAERKKKKDDMKQNFCIAAGKYILKILDDVNTDKFPEDFKKEIMAIHDKFLKG
jgi:ribosomal protein S25